MTLYDLEPEGVASVRFSTAEAARAAVGLLGGRAFAGKVVVAYLAKKGEKFRKSGKDAGGGGDGEEEEKEEEKRLEGFGKWLEEGN